MVLLLLLSVIVELNQNNVVWYIVEKYIYDTTKILFWTEPKYGNIYIVKNKKKNIFFKNIIYLSCV